MDISLMIIKFMDISYCHVLHMIQTSLVHSWVVHYFHAELIVLSLKANSLLIGLMYFVEWTHGLDSRTGADIF